MGLMECAFNLKKQAASKGHFKELLHTYAIYGVLSCRLYNLKTYRYKC